MGIMVVEDLERSDTVARESTTRAKTIVILTYGLGLRVRLNCCYNYRGVHTPTLSEFGLFIGLGLGVGLCLFHLLALSDTERMLYP